MNKSFFSLFAVVVIFMLCSCAADNAMRKGEKYLALGEYYDAAEQFKKAYSKTPPAERELRGKRALKAANCYARVGSTLKAISSYRNAVRFNQAQPGDRLTFARMLLKNGEYKAALKELEEIKDSNVSEGGSKTITQADYDMLVKNGIASAKAAPEWKKAGSAYTVKKMDVFNGRRADYCPVLAGDQYDRIYITSTRNEAQGDELSGITGAKPGDIFFFDKDEKGKWGKIQEIASGLNTEYDEGACCISVDGSTMYMTQCPTDPQYPRYATIATAPRSDAAWGKATELKITNDTLSSYAHPAISPDGEWLYFVSDMPGGKGGLDIWRIPVTEADGGGPENLGAPINTPGDEMFPTFRPNGDLYFSSDGHPGMGGLDLFCAKCDTIGKRTKWEIQNLRYPMNSCGDDFGMTFEGVHNRGFFCSNRGDARGWDHIMSFEYPEVVLSLIGWVYEKDGYELPEGIVYMIGNDGTNLKLNVKNDGSFTQEVKPNVDYIFLGTCKGYLNHKEELHVDTSSISHEYVLQFPLASINHPVLIRNVFYEFDSAKLTESSTMALDSLVDMLNENPNVTIELSSHCDYRGKDEYNDKLSQRRAESVVNYLISHGIEMERLTPVGYGEKRPKIVTRKVAEQNVFLHEGDTLTEAFITALPDEEQQEICNSLNRRTEFRVLRTTYKLFDKNENETSQTKNPAMMTKEKEEDKQQ